MKPFQLGALIALGLGGGLAAAVAVQQAAEARNSLQSQVNTLNTNVNSAQSSLTTLNTNIVTLNMATNTLVGQSTASCLAVKTGGALGALPTAATPSDTDVAERVNALITALMNSNCP